MHVCVFLSQSASVEHSHRFLGPSKMADRPGPRRDRTGHQYCHLASHFRCFPAVFPLFSRCVPAGSTTIKRQEEPRGIGRKSVCVCHVKLMHHHHVSGRCVPVSKCVSRAFSDRLPSKPSKHGGSASLQKRVLCPRTFSLHHQTARICADSSTGVYPFLTHSPPLLTDVAETMTSMHRGGTDTQDGEGVHASSSCVVGVFLSQSASVEHSRTVCRPSRPNMADRPPYRNESSVHAPFPYITRRPGFVQTPPQESTHS